MEVSVADERKKQLFLSQKQTLDSFLSTGAISTAQYDFSLNGLITKMGISHSDLKEWGILTDL